MSGKGGRCYPSPSLLQASSDALSTCPAPGCRSAALSWEQFVKSLGHTFTGKLEWVGGRTGWSRVPLQAFKQVGLLPQNLGQTVDKGEPCLV